MHTPGPWKAGATLANDGSRAIVADDYRVATASLIVDAKRGEAWKADDAERDANARLISAAPALLELAQAIAEHFADTDAPLGKRARAVIAWATQ
jgi:hypothetical protein